MSSPPVCEPAWWREPRARALVAWGVALVVSGLAHVAVWGALGGPWEGAVSWRKPILFGISGGLTSLSLAWVWSKLTWRRGDAVLARLTAAALVVEVALIDLQRWRGVASHFNRTTPLDSILYDTMGILILFVSAIAVDLCIRLFLQPVELEPDARLAARAGMLFLVVSCALGIWVSVHGDVRVAAGLEPERYGAAGVPKFPHGSVIHALQWLPALAWGAAWAGMSPRRRRQIVSLATAGTLLVLVYSLVQTFSGRSRTDAEPVTAAILAAGVIL
ncbi:MAG: hypothetical protein ACKOEM_11295, partial [Planctomycetia bacterium]